MRTLRRSSAPRGMAARHVASARTRRAWRRLRQRAARTSPRIALRRRLVSVYRAETAGGYLAACCSAQQNQDCGLKIYYQVSRRTKDKTNKN